MTHAVDQEQLGVGDLRSQRVSVLGREHRVLPAVNDERRRSDVAEALAPGLAGVDRERVCGAGFQIDGAINDAFCPRSRGGRVEVGGVGPLEFDEVLDDGRSIGPVELASFGESNRWGSQMFQGDGCGG